MTFLEPEAKFENKVVQKEPLIVQEHENITLTTSVTPETAAVRWFKDGTEIKANKKYEIKSEGASRTLTVNLAGSTDTAIYTCQTKSDKQEFKVQVKGKLRAAHSSCPSPTAMLLSWYSRGKVQTLSKTVPTSRLELLLQLLWLPYHRPAKFFCSKSPVLSFADHSGRQGSL